MKTPCNSRAHNTWQSLAFAIVLGLLALPAARAGLAIDLDLDRGDYQGYQYYQFYCGLNTNGTPPNVSYGDYFVVSPGWPTNANASATLFHFDATGFNQVSGSGSGDFSQFDAPDFSDSFIQNITNGQWSIFVTNAVTTNVYYFSVTANITSNAIPLVSIIYPPNNALNVTNQPTIIWQSPTNYDEQILYGPDFGYDLPVTQQSYSDATFADGLNGLTLDTYYHSSTGVVCSVPTNSAGSALSGWVSTWRAWDYANVQFTVGSPSVDFNAALGTTDLPWATMGDAAWFSETTNTANGSPSAAQSGSVTDGQFSTLSVTVTGPGTLTFYWSSIAEDPNQGFDFRFEIDGNYADDIYGDTAWFQEVDPNTSEPFVIPAGRHVLTWKVNAGGDTDPTEAGFLDNVSYVTVPSPSLTVTAAPSSGLAPLPVQFTSPGSDSFGNTITNWSWDFGDGGTSTAQSPSHVYTNAGSFYPRLIAFSTYGTTPLTVNGPDPITVSNPSLAVSATPPYGLAPLTVQFFSPTTDSAGNTVTNWSWTFGDGGTSTARNPTHIYTSTGFFTPGLTAYSTHGTSPLEVTGLYAINTYSNPIPAFRTLYTFSPNFGSGPNAGLAISGNRLYGTTVHGGISGQGTVFALNTDGTGFTNIYDNFVASATNGADPNGGLVLSGSTLYGTTYGGGTLGGGTVFALGTNGLGFTNLANFDFHLNPNSPDEPQAPVVLSGDTLYGTTWYGGSHNEGTIFSVATNASTSGILHSFTTPSYTPYINNNDGVFPSAKLIASGGALYGTALNGGLYGGGTVFSVVTNQPNSFSVLHYFSLRVNGTNSDGANSFSSLVLSGTNLYGTTFGGGTHGFGTIFAVSTNGVFTNLYNFTGTNDGSGPHGGLTLSGNRLYGSTSTGGVYTNGTLFAINTDGSNFNSLYSFTGGADGSNPGGDLVLSGNTLYGTAGAGTGATDGTVFSYTLTGPPLAIARSGTNVILTWSASAAGYTLQSSLQVGAAAAWSNVSPLPVVLNSLNTVTNPIAPATKFYRLSQ